MKLKNSLTLLIAALLALSMAACVNKNKDTPAAENTATTGQAATPAEAKPDDPAKTPDGKTPVADPTAKINPKDLKIPANVIADAKKVDEDAPAEPEPTGPVANVNGVEIKREVLNKELDELRKRFAMFGGKVPEAQITKFKSKIVKRLVEDELINQKLTQEKITATDKEIDAELAEHKKNMPGGEAQFEAFLKRSGMTVDQVRSDIGKRVALEKYLNNNKALEVTEEAIKKYYDENPKLYEVKERVKASHILIKTEEGKDDAEAKKAIEEIYKEATKKGADFAELAKKKSQGPSAPRGGDLGEFGPGRMVPEFEKVAFELKPGEISKPVKTKFGWHIIKVFEKMPAGKKEYKEVQEQIMRRLEARQFREARDKLIEQLNKEGKVEVFDK